MDRKPITIKTDYNPSTRMTPTNNRRAAMIRLVRDLRNELDELGVIDDAADVAIDNVVYEFLATCPKCVREEVLHG